MTLGPLMIDVAGLALQPEERERLSSPLVGGVILFSRNFASTDQLRELTAEIHALRQPPLLIAVDQEGGRVQRFRDGFTRLPPARWYGRQHDLDADEGRRLARLGSWLMAAELLELGVDLSFAPVVDLDWGVSEVIGDRALHSEPAAVSELALAWMQGMRDAGMAAVAKHFPGHGAVIADSHAELPEDHRSLADMQDDLRPYQALIDHGLPGVMVAHLRYTAVDQDIASLSRYWLETELRGKLRFSGAIFSDDLDMAGAAGAGDMAERARLALSAGADMALICNNPDAAAAVLEAGDLDNGPASHGRLAAMRPVRSPGAQSIRGSLPWQAAVDALNQAQQPPALRLDG